MSRLEFGTAGIRGRMGPGYANINDLTIIQTSQGFVSYVQTQHALANMKELIVIGYDGRHNSRRLLLFSNESLKISRDLVNHGQRLVEKVLATCREGAI